MLLSQEVKTWEVIMSNTQLRNKKGMGSEERKIASSGVRRGNYKFVF